MDKNIQNLLKTIITVSVEGVILFFIFVYLNISSAFGGQFPDVSLFSGEAWRITSGCALTLGGMLLVLYFHKKMDLFFLVWKKSLWLVLFLLFSTLSLLWTVSFPATLYELMLLFFATLAASYLAARYGLSGFIEVLTWIAACTVIVSLLVVFFTPFGIMMNEPFTGSWDGLFWHRNHAGSLMAFFSMIFLFRMLLDDTASFRKKLLFAFFYLLAVVHVFGSRSATGILIFIFLNLACFAAWFWAKFRRKLIPKHYYIMGVVALAAFFIFIFNLDFFFGLLGRSANMTGRVPLWKDLLFTVYLSKPLLGHGYGAIWMQESFRILMQIRHGWKYPVYFADNGYLDILLNLGAVGFVLFIMMFFTTFRKNVQKILQTHSWQYIFTLMILLYVASGNLAYSFLLEVDHFVWTCLIVVMFLMQLSEVTSQEQATAPKP